MKVKDAHGNIIDYYLIDFSLKAKIPIGSYVLSHRDGPTANMLSELGFNLNSSKLVRGIVYIDAINNQNIQCIKINKDHYIVLNDGDSVLDIKIKHNKYIADYVIVKDLRLAEPVPAEAVTMPVCYAEVISSTQSTTRQESLSSSLAAEMNLKPLENLNKT